MDFARSRGQKTKEDKKSSPVGEGGPLAVEEDNKKRGIESKKPSISRLTIIYYSSEF